MAAPMSADAWLAALHAEGVTDIVEMPGWRTNNRDRVGPWGPVHATMVHHTAGEGPGMSDLLYGGRADLPGPLCHDYVDRAGVLYLVGHGRANHAGSIAANSYAAVLAELPDHPVPDAAEPLDGNTSSYGMEVENSGASGRPWTPAQCDVAVRVQAARCRYHGWSAQSVWAHKEATRRKPLDPRIDMSAFRAAVDDRLQHDPGWSPSTKENDVTLTADDIKRLASLDGVFVAPPDAGDYSPDPADSRHYWALGSHITDQTTRTRAIQRELSGLVAAVSTLTRLIGSGVDTEAVVTAVRDEIAKALRAAGSRGDGTA